MGRRGGVRDGSHHAASCSDLRAAGPTAARRRTCSAYAAGLVIYVAEIDRGFLPDLVVICGPPSEAPGKSGAITNPNVVFEVLSPRTQTYDRTTKLEAYQRLASLEAYVLLHQHEARAEAYRRSGSAFELEERLGGILELPHGLRLDLDAL